MKAKDERKFADQLTWRWGFSACLGGSTVIRKILTHGMAVGDREWGRHVKDSAWHYGLQMTEVMSQGRQVSSRSWKKRQVDFLFRNFLIEYNSIPSLAKRKTFLTFDFDMDICVAINNSLGASGYRSHWLQPQGDTTKREVRLQSGGGKSRTQS